MIRANPFGAARPSSDLAAKTVGEAMREGLAFCSPGLPLADVAKLMADGGLHVVVVAVAIDSGSSSWEVISDLDLIAAASVRSLDDQVAAGAAAKPVDTIAPDTNLRSAAQLMVEHGAAHLIVTEPASSRPIGVLSTLDIVAALARSG